MSRSYSSPSRSERRVADGTMGNEADAADPQTVDLA
jgi:hypothetical protein